MKRQHLLPLIKKSQQWLYVLYYPSLGFFTERCNYYLLPTKLGDTLIELCYFHHSDNKYFIVIAAKLLPLSFFRQWGSTLSTTHRLKMRRALYFHHSDNKMVLKIPSVGEMYHSDNKNGISCVGYAIWEC